MFEQINAYCERTGPGLWQEPLNTLASLVVMLGALWLHGRIDRQSPYRMLALGIVAIGLTGTVSHMVGNLLSLALALAAIATFALLALYRICLDLLTLRPAMAALASAMFLPFTLAAMPLLTLAPGMEGSLGLLPFPILLIGLAAVLRSQNQALAREFLLAGLGLLAALALRGLDGPLCGVWPAGTHFLYILLGGAVLLRLVAVCARPALAGAERAG